ncbi:hypothetical protein [Mycobacterium sp. ACS4054]|uniref:hypothetical protein n=1 Tax=Mycobacterium sp. ACS4054 TaxID=1834119 RepID=UPI003511B97F
MNGSCVEPLFTRPRACVAANAFGIKNLLSRRHKFVARRRACIRGVTVAAQLNGLDLCDLLGKRLFRGENLIYLSVARIRNVCQSTSQIVDCISSRIEGSRLRLVLLSKIEMKFFAFLVPRYKVIRCVALIMCRDHCPLISQVLREQLLLDTRLAPMLSCGA